MAPTTIQHRRTHNILLISKLLNQRDASSPFTLVLDNLEQSGKPVLAEYSQRAKAAKLKVVFLSFETLRQPKDIDTFIAAWDQTPQTWQREVATHTKPVPNQRNLLVIDTLNPLASTQPSHLPILLSSLINPTTSLLALYHTDIPLATTKSHDPYSPPPLTLLRYLATTLITTHSLAHILALKAARDRSVAPPTSGLSEGVEGVLQGLGANGNEGVVLEVEHRRKSGRGVREWYFLLHPEGPKGSGSGSGTASSKTKGEAVILLQDHPAYKLSVVNNEAEADGEELGPEASAGTFELGLTERQREAREGVVLPYFDAQKGGGEGGRILYDMGEEDDFDEDEDEI